MAISDSQLISAKTGEELSLPTNSSAESSDTQATIEDLCKKLAESERSVGELTELAKENQLVFAVLVKADFLTAEAVDTARTLVRMKRGS